MSLAGGAIGGNGTTTNTGNFLWAGGSITGTGGLTNQSSQFTISSGGINGGSVLTNSGTITQLANSTVMGSGGIAVINNLSGAVWNLQGDNSQIVDYIAFNNAGIFRKSSGTGTANLFYNYTSGSQYGFNNTGTLEVDSGILGIGNGSNSGGSIVVANGAMLQLGLDAGEGCVFTLHGSPSISGSGVVQVPAYAAVRVTNGETATLGTSSPGVSIVVSGGNLYPDAGSTLLLNCLGGSALSLAGGAIGGNGTTTNIGNFLWAGGSITGTGGLTNQSSQFTISSGGINGGSVLTNSGTITQLANSTVMGSGGIAVINNLSGAVWNLQGDNSQVVDYIAFNNAGIFRKSSGTGTANLFYNYTSGSQYGFNNTGTLEVDSGILGIGNGSNSGGNIVVANGVMLQLGLDAGEGCVFTLHGSTTITGSGVVQVPAYAAVRVTNGETATLGTSSPGVSIVVSGGNLYPDAGSTLLLNCVGGSALSLAGGAIGGNGTTTNIGNFLWAGGSITGTGGLTNQSSQFTISGNGGQTLNGTLKNSGTIAQVANGVLSLSSTVNNLAGAVYNLQGSCTINGHGTINNAGSFLKSSGTATANIYSYFNNTGTVEVDAGTLSFASSFIQTAGSTNLNGGSLTFSGSAQILGGEILGSGTINGSIVNSGGLLSPGHSPGSLILNGNYTEGAAGALLIELGGLGSGQFDYLDVDGTDSLGGTLEIAFLGGYHPALGDTFHFMDFNSRSGQFATIEVLGSPGYQFNTVYTSNGAIWSRWRCPSRARYRCSPSGHSAWGFASG